MTDIVDVVLKSEFDRATRMGRPLSVLALVRRDLPLGISAKLLQEASVAVRTATREYDAAGVIGDRIIVVVLPETNATGANVVAERLRQELANRNGGRAVWSALVLPDAEKYEDVDRLIAALVRLYAGTRPIEDVVHRTSAA